MFSRRSFLSEKILRERDTEDHARLCQDQWDLLYYHRYYGSIHVRVTAEVCMLLFEAIFDNKTYRK